MTERDAFIIGVTAFCKDAGFDADDSTEFVRLLLMEPFRAMPIIKRANMRKSAGWWDNTVNGWRDLWNSGVNWQDPWGTARKEVENQSRKTEEWNRKHREAVALQKNKYPDDPSKHVGILGTEDEIDAADKMRMDMNKAIHASTGTGDKPPKINTYHEANTAGMGPLEKEKYMNDVRSKRLRENNEAARDPGMDAARARLGLSTGKAFEQRQQSIGDRRLARMERRRLERAMGVGDLLKVNPEEYDANLRGDITALQKYYGQKPAPTTAGGTTVPSGRPSTPTSAPSTTSQTIPSSPKPMDAGDLAVDRAVGLNRDYKPEGELAATVTPSNVTTTENPAGAGGITTQTSSSPAPDTAPKPQDLAAKSMKGSQPQTPGTPPASGSTTTGAAPAGQSTQPKTRNNSWANAGNNAGADVNKFLSDPRLASLNRSMRGQSGSVEIGLPGGGTYRSDNSTARDAMES